MRTIEPRVTEERLRSRLERLAQFGALPEGGITRPAWSAAYENARVWLRHELSDAGFKVWMDSAGNLFGGIPAKAFSSSGLLPDQRAILTGSHIDTVPQGGMFDGALGVVAGIECLQTIREAGCASKYPLVVASWIDEEGYYGSLFGSRAFTGRIDPSQIPAMAAPNGDRLIDAMARAGFDASRVPDAKAPPRSVQAYVELHIEQGPYLERASIPIGVVEAIIGVRRSRVIFIGRPDHAGTMPMGERQDAFLAAADYALKSRDILKTSGRDHSVMNIGNVVVYPGAANVVPSRVELLHEFRDPSSDVLQTLSNGFMEAAREVAHKNRVKVDFKQLSQSQPVPCSERIVCLTEEVASAFGLMSRRMYSAAGHDVLNLATIAEAGMIFVPSKGGRSHCPEEVSDWKNIEYGSNVLLHALLRLAN